jgi:hypothetical protein
MPTAHKLGRQDCHGWREQASESYAGENALEKQSRDGSVAEERANNQFAADQGRSDADDMPSISGITHPSDDRGEDLPARGMLGRS